MAPESNSASRWWRPKIALIVQSISFFLMIGCVLGQISLWVRGLPIAAELGTAIVYLITGFCFWSLSKTSLPNWAPVPMAIAAASVILLKWDMHVYHIMLFGIWALYWWRESKGMVVPWSVGWRCIFIPNAELERMWQNVIAREETPKAP